MHPLLKNLCDFNFYLKFDTEEKCISLLQDLGLIPNKNDDPPLCPKCKSKMIARCSKKHKLQWKWTCRVRMENNKECSSCVNPLQNTFFECIKASFREVLLIIFGFVQGIPVTHFQKNLCALRASLNQPAIHIATIIDFYSFCQEVAEVYASHHSMQLGGVGKSIELSETFFTHRKYNKGKRNNSVGIPVYGMYCPDDKEGVFFKVDCESMSNLLPLVKHYCHPDTEIIHVESSKLYKNTDNLSAQKTIQKGKKGEKTIENNTASNLENEKKNFKKRMTRKINSNIIECMALKYYRRYRFTREMDFGEMMQQFLLDIKAVYPGYNKSGLKLLEIALSNTESENIRDLMPPPPKRCRKEVLLECEEIHNDIPFIDDLSNEVLDVDVFLTKSLIFPPEEK